MSDEKSHLRKVYDAAERRAAPPLSAIATNADTYNALAVIVGLRRFIGRGLDGVTGGLWHVAGLPSRGDVRRLRSQIGQLDREVRRLTVQLELEQDRSAESGGSDERA